MILTNIKAKFMMIIFLHGIYKNIQDLVMNHRQTFYPCLLVQYIGFLCRTMIHNLKYIFLIFKHINICPRSRRKNNTNKNSVMIVVLVVYRYMCKMHVYLGRYFGHALNTYVYRAPKQQSVHYFL